MCVCARPDSTWEVVYTRLLEEGEERTEDEEVWRLHQPAEQREEEEEEEGPRGGCGTEEGGGERAGLGDLSDS